MLNPLKGLLAAIFVMLLLAFAACDDGCPSGQVKENGVCVPRIKADPPSKNNGIDGDFNNIVTDGDETDSDETDGDDDSETDSDGDSEDVEDSEEEIEDETGEV